LTWVAGYTPGWFARPKTVTHQSANWTYRFEHTEQYAMGL